MSATPTPAARPGAARVGLVLLAVYGVFWAQFAAVRADNFGGLDEWLILSLVSRGAIEIPYANRPLGLLFNLPVSLFPSHLLEASFLLHAHYLVLVGVLTSLLLLRLAPEWPEWALLAGVFAAAWAPSDLLRLDSIYSAAYSGVTALVMLVLLLLVAGERRRILVVVAAGLAFVCSRVHEGPLPLLLAAPVLLRALGARLDRRSVQVFLGVGALAALVAALPLLRGRPEAWYQRDGLGLYLDPAGVAARIAWQFRAHLEPLVSTPPRALRTPGALAVVLVLASAVVLVTSRAASQRNRQRPSRALFVGVAAAVLAYAPFALSASMMGANRAEFLAAPWIGLALASGMVLAAEALPAAARGWALALPASFVVAVGTARTAGLQQVWDRIGAYGRHSGSASQIVRLAPDLKPGTLVLLIDGARAWVGTFTFHHALELLYGRHVAGCLAGPPDGLFYSCALGPEGVRHRPWPILEAAWGETPRTHGFDEIVIFRADASGRVSLVEEWPSELPPLPAGARYAPRSRLGEAASFPAARAILKPLRPG